MDRQQSYLGKYRPYQICTRCIMDTTVPEIQFDEHGVCQFCFMHDKLEVEFPEEPNARSRQLAVVVDQIKRAGKGRKYDCVCGTSGGRDSTYVLHTVVKILGLRPLAVHFDNGWNSEIAVRNIKNACEKLNVDLETVVADWEEFKDLQVSFLKASTPDVEVPTDVAIHAVLHKVAAKENIKYVLNGHSFRTEGISPIGWTYIDGYYIDAIQKRFGGRPLRDFHNFRIWDLIYCRIFKGIQVVPILNYFDYEPKAVQGMLEQELGWQYYGGHHHESYYTKFIQSYLLPKKFNIDKRKTELSALIRSRRVDRQTALREVQAKEYEYDEGLVDYVIPKLGISRSDWDEIFSATPKSFQSYPSYYRWMRLLRAPIRWACEFGILPRLLYLKYLAF